jgi:hypothetical protein
VTRINVGVDPGPMTTPRAGDRRQEAIDAGMMVGMDTWEGYPPQEGLVWRRPLLPTPGFSERFKVCLCCGNEYDLGSWMALPCNGTQRVPPGDGPNEPEHWLEYRTCPCGTTLAIELRP